MKKISAIFATLFIAAMILATTACSHPEGTSDGSKPANNASPSAGNTGTPANKAGTPQNAGSTTNPSMGGIKIGSRPAGATILLIATEGSDAGKPQTRGTSPTTITDLTPGKYTVFLELKGFKPFEKAVEVKAGETVTVTTDLKK